MLFFDRLLVNGDITYCFTISDNQFGFKKEHGCSHAIYTLRCVVDSYLASGSTINVCALDLTKAVD